MQENGWVIERADSSAAEPKYWCAGFVESEHSSDGTRFSDWTSNHLQAIRFARQLDAERVAERSLKRVAVRICEHIWGG